MANALILPNVAGNFYAGMDRAADNHYPTSDADALAERRKLIDDIAAEHCVLGLWVTDLARGIDLMREWGFEPKSRFGWLKNLAECIDLSDDDKATIGLEGRRVFVYLGAPGTGYWGRDEFEICLIGTRGHPVCPAMGEQGSSVWIEPKREHSEKPDCAIAWADKHFAHTPRIELNARRRRPGWQAWGNEVEPGNRDIIALEREALVRGLIDKAGMVRVDDNRVVAFNFVTADEWRALLVCTEPQTVMHITSDVATDRIEIDADAIASNTASDPLDIPAFLQRKVDSSQPAGVAGNRET